MLFRDGKGLTCCPALLNMGVCLTDGKTKMNQKRKQ